MSLDLDAIRARAAAASAGPWSATDLRHQRGGQIRIFPAGGYFIANVLAGRAHTDGDAAFIAHARQDVDDLLAEVERLRGKCTCATGDYACMDGVVWGPCIHVGYCPDRDEDGDEAIAHCECKACHPDMAVTT